MATKKKMPIRTQDVHLEGEWEGWNAKIRSNPPVGPWINKMQELASLDKEDPATPAKSLSLMLELLGGVLVSWDFVDDDGEPLPANEEGLRSIGIELLGELFAAANKTETEAPLVNSEP